MLNFSIGVLAGIGLSAIALYASTKLAKPLSDVFTVNPIKTGTTIPKEPIRPAQIIKMDDPIKQFEEKENE